jgi:hypothetical protein
VQNCERMKAVEVVHFPLLVLAMAMPFATPDATAGNPVSNKEAGDIAVEAYVYLYPLVTMDVTRRQATGVEAGKMPGRGPMNSSAHLRAFPDASYREVVRPNL